jgi:hypothetical protein
MDAFETARQAFFSGKIAPNSSTTFTQTKSFDGMPAESTKKAPVLVLQEELALASR